MVYLWQCCLERNYLKYSDFKKEHHNVNLIESSYKGLERQRLIGLSVAGFKNARTITKDSD